MGYGRATRLIDMREGKGTVGPMNNAKPREILIPKEAVNPLFSGLGKADAIRAMDGFTAEEDEE